MRRAAILVGVLAAARAAAAEPARHRLPRWSPARPPVTMAMRVATRPDHAAPVTPASPDESAVLLGGGPKPEARGPAAEPAAAFVRIPHTMRDLRERVTFRLDAGFRLDDAPASGQPLPGGASLPADFSDSRAWLTGDALVAARDLLLPSLGGYLLTSFQLDTTDAMASRAATVSPFDAGDGIAIKAGYAEWGRDDRKPDDAGLWLRGGRQVRLDGGALFAYFDGATVGYRRRGVELSGFAGQRVALYVDTPKGIQFGATAAVDLAALRKAPVQLALDYQGLAIDVLDEAQTRSLLVASGRAALGHRGTVEARVRLVAIGDGLTLGRIGARARYTLGRSALAQLDVERRQGGDLAYDLTAASAVDIVDIARALGVGLGPPADTTAIGGSFDLRRRRTELLVFGRTELASAPTRTDQRGFVEGGLAVAGTFIARRGTGAWLTAQYKLRHFFDGGHDGDQAGSTFGDSSTSGADTMHELAADATYRRGSGARRWRLGAGAFYRIHDVSTPYRTVTDDGRGGARLDGQLWLTRELRLQVAAEGAQARSVLAPELGFLTSVRATLEARW